MGIDIKVLKKPLELYQSVASCCSENVVKTMLSIEEWVQTRGGIQIRVQGTTKLNKYQITLRNSIYTLEKHKIKDLHTKRNKIYYI